VLAIRGHIVPLSSDPVVALSNATVFAHGVWVGVDGIVAAITRGSTAGSPGSDLRGCVAAVALHDVPSWPNDHARGRQSRPKRRNRVERGPTDLFHTLIWLAPAG
jgi:hypothetical protein